MAGELAAVGELARRRPAPVLGQDGHLDEEVGAALTCRAARLTGLAAGLARLPGTAAALAAGRIDGPRAVVIADETSALDDAAARLNDGESFGASVSTGAMSSPKAVEALGRVTDNSRPPLGSFSIVP